MRIITLGTFDCLHRGHLVLLRQCRNLAWDDDLIIGLNTDEFVEKYKGYPPIMSYDERKQMIEETGIVNKIIPNSQKSGNAKDIIKQSRAKLIAIGSDWAVKDYVRQLGINWDWLDRQKIGIVYFNYTKGISTTEIKKRICARQS